MSEPTEEINTTASSDGAEVPQEEISHENDSNNRPNDDIFDAGDSSDDSDQEQTSQHSTEHQMSQSTEHEQETSQDNEASQPTVRPTSESGEQPTVSDSEEAPRENDSNSQLNDDVFDTGEKSDESDREHEASGDEEAEKNDDGDLMSKIFGEDSGDEEGEEEGAEKPKDDEGKIDSDDGEPRFLRVEMDSDGEQKEWDFDVMLRKKKAERKRKRRKDGSISLISDADDQVKALVDAMSEAANDDRQSNIDKRPAIQKRKMLQIVRTTLMKSDLFETLLDNGMMNAVSDWLAPLPDKSLPALEVRSTLLKILQSYPAMEQGILKQSGLGKAVMFLFKHPKETRENKTIAAKLIREWSRPIFQLDTDFRSLSREERLQRDFAHMPESKRKRLSLDEDGIPSQPTSSQAARNADNENADTSASLRPGDAGFILRARVPKPSTKDYVVRPKSVVEGRFQGPSKNRNTDRFDKAQREFRERNRSQKAKRAIGVSLEGRKMDI